MRVVVFGATGNVGTSVLPALAADPKVKSVLGVARRLPQLSLPKVAWAAADVSSSNLVPLLRGADVVVHLAWLIQPSHDERRLAATNVTGSERLFDAAAEAGVGSIVYASSIGAYSPGPKDEPVDETWPTEGIASSYYSRHKVAVERYLDGFEARHPHIRVVRLRKALIFKREAGAGVARLFLGPLVPRRLVRTGLVPILPSNPRLVFQAVHSLDVGEAYRLAVVGDARGAFNIAAEPVLDPAVLAQVLGAKPVTVPPALLRAVTQASWRLRLQPTSGGWVDMAHAVPVMDTARARTVLGWAPRHDSRHALCEVLEGIRDNDGLPTPALAPDRGGPVHTLRTPARSAGSGDGADGP
jgi:nucleoside-diphosphate-sugar epimerase